MGKNFPCHGFQSPVARRSAPLSRKLLSNSKPMTLRKSLETQSPPLLNEQSSLISTRRLSLLTTPSQLGGPTFDPEGYLSLACRIARLPMYHLIMATPVLSRKEKKTLRRSRERCGQRRAIRAGGDGLFFFLQQVTWPPSRRSL